MASSVLTGKDWKMHLQYLRDKRQEQLHVTIEECQRLQHLHRELFNQQIQSKTKLIRQNEHIEKNSTNRSMFIEDLKLPRDYSSLIQRRLSSENDEHQNLIENDRYRIQSIPVQIEVNAKSGLSSRRRLSVSTVDSKEKRAHKVFEKWPDYNEISQIVGFRIEPPKAKILTTTHGRSTKKRDSSSRLIAATKQITRLVNLNSIATRRSKTSEPNVEKLPILSEPIAPIIVPPVAPRLPSSLCPSSMIFSQRIQTRQWLLKNNFAHHATRTCPLI